MPASSGEARFDATAADSFRVSSAHKLNGPRFVASTSKGSKCPPAGAPQHGLGPGLRPTGVHTALTRRVAAAGGRKDPWFQYLRDHPGLEGIAVCKRLPPDEYFSQTYMLERVKATASVVYNGVLSRVFLQLNRSADDDLDDLDDFVKWYPPFLVKLNRFQRLACKLLGLPPPKVPDTRKFVQLPDIAEHFENDAVFGVQRLAGLNPVNLRGLDADDPRCDIISGVPGATAALQAGKMFVLDYTGRPVGDGPADWIMPDAPIKGGFYTCPETGKQKRKALPQPIGFFKWQDGRGSAAGQLLPIAIQLHEDGRIYTPKDGRYDWIMAKAALSIADANNHEMVTHLGKTHFFMEAFAVATRRCFSADHALSYLLRAHTRFLIANNRLGRDKLVAVGGYTDRILSGTIAESVEMARVAVLATHLLEDNFKNDLVKRKVGRDRLPYYPFRDDGEKLWDAIWDYMTEYVGAIYATDTELREDKELQEWCAELADPNQGSVNGMPSKVTTAKELVEILTTVIFTSGPGHCAVNYAQHPMAGYVPNLPLNARDPYRELSKRPASQPLNEKDVLRMLPNQRCTRDQSEVLFILSAYQFDSLGEYDKAFDSMYAVKTDELLEDHPKGAALKQAMDNFKGALKKAEKEIEAANANGLVDYDYLMPSAVLNSTSI